MESPSSATSDGATGTARSRKIPRLTRDPAFWAGIYADLRRLAARFMSRERRNHSLCPTELVHETWLRLQDAKLPPDAEQTHVVALATVIMRRVLVDHARRKRADKRGGGTQLMRLSGVPVPVGDKTMQVIDVLILDEALSRLEEQHPRWATLVHLRCIGGFTAPECAEVLGVSLATVEKDWAIVRSWLARELRPRDDGGGC